MLDSEAEERVALAGLESLSAMTEAVEAGAGLPDVVRAAARALDASLAVVDRSGAVLAVAARSPADERSLLHAADDVRTVALRLAAAEVGQLRWRPRGASPSAALLGLVSTLVAGEVQRVRAPERASEEAAVGFQRDVLGGRAGAREDLLARGHELGLDLAAGGSVLVVRAHPHRPADPGWRRRFLAAIARAARSSAPGAIAAPAEAGSDDVVVLLGDPEGTVGARLAEAVLRELEASLPGFHFALGRSQPAADPGALRRAGAEALLAANVGEGAASRVLAYEALGTYKLIFPLFMEHPGEVQRFYADTVEPLVAYDEQYETDLVGTLETFLDCDGNFGAAAARLFTHRHTVRYRLGRIRELSGLDAASTDGREKLSLGLKAMRVLGLAAPRGPASEPGAGGGRVPREAADR